MTKDELIALGLRGLRPAAQPPATPAVPALDPLKVPVERLLALLRDFVAVVELADEGSLVDRIEECRRAVVNSPDIQALHASIDTCNAACRQVLAKIDRHRMEQKKEIAS